MASRRKWPAVSRLRRVPLSGRWRLEGTDSRGAAIDVSARVPGVVQWDLQRAGVIPDPFEGANEDAVKWVALQQWTYRLKFRASRQLIERRHVELVFEGLDTCAEVALNGSVLGRTANMFVEHRFDVRQALFAGYNELRVTFLSPIEEGLRLHQERASVPLYEPDGNPRPYTRKAQYSYGWDWGPKITTSGIWRDVYIEAWDAARIESVYWRTLRASPESARVQVTVDVAGSGRPAAEAVLGANGQSVDIKLSRRRPGQGLRFTGAADVSKPLLWWPAGQGAQDLYDAEVALKAEGVTVDRHSCRIGLRTVKLKRQKDEEGEGFIFEVNGREVFCKGADWIPADSYLPRITRRDYEDWVWMAADANMNMLRVWGGGIYESPHFYSACDRYGVMVWQDFMFACAEYPEDEDFLAEVGREAVHVVKALRNHPSIVLWCGNNENQWGAHSWWHKKRYGGKTIYDRVLPSVVRRADPSRPYWPGSPYGGADPNSESRGDRHNWEGWSSWKDWSAYLSDKGRFLSEFGYQAAPALETVAKFGPLGRLHPQHPLFERHNKQVEGPERLARFLAGSFRPAKDLSDYVHLTQLVQAEAIKAGALHWRARMMRTSGVLYWQLNDCWPVVSWAAVDYARRPKALYYYTRRFFEPLAVWVIARQEGIFASVINDAPGTVRGELAVQALTFEGVEVGCVREEVEIGANGVHRIGPLKPELLGATEPSNVCLVAMLKCTDGRRVSDVGFLLRPKHLRLPNPGLWWKVRQADGAVNVILHAKRFAYGVWLRLPGSEARFSDNFLTMLPGQSAEITITGRRLSAAAVAKRLVVSHVRGVV